MSLPLVEERRLCAKMNRFEEWKVADDELRDARRELREAEKTYDVEVHHIDRVRKAEEAEKAARKAHDRASKISIAEIMKGAK
jgi:hypothetical protein